MLIHVPDDPVVAAEARAAIVADSRLTFGALGLLLVILDHAPEWRVNVGGLAQWVRDRRGEEAEDPVVVRNLFLELVVHGYIDFTRPLDADGNPIEQVEVFTVPQRVSPDGDKRQVVYVIGQPGQRVAKIGTTSNLRARLRAIQTGCPVRLEVLWTCPGGRVLESWLHRAFGERRLEGEWFDFGEYDPVLSVQKTVEQARIMGIE